MPCGALRKNLSLHDFKNKYAAPGSPLHARSSGHPNDISSPDFSDWMVHLSELISWTGVSMEDPNNEIYFEDEADSLRKEGSLCRPEDYICTQGCHSDKKSSVSNAKYRFVKIVSCAWKTTTSHLQL